MRGLVADDDPLTCVMLAQTLEHSGLEVVVAHDGREAWEALQRDPGIALAVLGWKMPVINGPDLCRRIRHDESLAHMYVLLLTARDRGADLVAGLDAGADDYLIKPIPPEALRARVHLGLRVLALHERLADQAAQQQTALSKLRQLHGLRPICSYCKYVRTDQNSWEQVEDYVAQHTDMEFTHGICPVCYEAVMTQLENRASG
jgi:sigma-B regulation protein RsbU (phosphoserine phosphatase)